MDTKLNEERAWLTTGALMILSAVAIAVALIYTEPVMVPFVLAIFTVTIVSPVVDFLVVRLRFPHWLAIMGALLLVLVVMVVLVFLLYTAILEINAKATDYADRFSTLTDNVIDEIQATGILGKNADQVIDNMSNKLVSEFKASLPSLITGTLGTATNIISLSFLVIIFVVFLLAGRQSPPSASGIYAEIENAVRKYITTKFLISAATGVLIWLILSAFGLPMAGLFGMLAFLLNFIPSIGSIIATMLPIPVAVAEFSDRPLMIVAVVAFPGLVHTIIGNVLEPKLMGKGLDMHPVTVIIALAAWGLLWGPIGMVLAVPITAMIRIVLIQFEITRPIGNLLAGKLPGKPAASTAN